MPDDALAALAHLLEEGEFVMRHAQSVESTQASLGSDPTHAVTATLDTHGQVSAVTVQAGWQRRTGAGGLAGAVMQAVRDASIRRLTAIGPL